MSFTVAVKGVGRKDYSEGTEFSVEPTIRSYQSVYNHWEDVTVPAGDDLVVNISLTEDYVAILYDFYVSFSLLTLMSLHIAAVSNGTVGHVIMKSGYGTVAAHLEKGFPFFETVRFTLHNYHDEDIAATIGAVGIYTDEEHYYLRAVSV